jgi:hypothetical protein
MIKFLEPNIKTRLVKKYIQLYAQVRYERYPLEHGFLVTKIRFQEYIIDEMFKYPNQVREIISAYSSIKEDKTVQEKALKAYEANCKYETFLDGVNRS